MTDFSIKGTGNTPFLRRNSDSLRPGHIYKHSNALFISTLAIKMKGSTRIPAYLGTLFYEDFCKSVNMMREEAFNYLY